MQQHMPMLPRRTVLVGIGGSLVASCGSASVAALQQEAYSWSKLTDAAAFPKSYNFPVHTARDGRFVALHSEGTWSSRDGVSWMPEALAPSGTNTAYLALLKHGSASVALGRIQGNYLDFRLEPSIATTTDYRDWTIARAENMPAVVFYAAASFAGYIWILGGFDGRSLVNDVWRSPDGVAWEAMPAPPWSPRARNIAAEFGGRLLMIGGGGIDGVAEGEGATGEVWATSDGRQWSRLAESIGQPTPVGYTPQVFDDKLWLVGTNRSGGFGSEMIVTSDGIDWQPVTAPWSPRGGVAAWSDGSGLYLTGGKYSQVVEGETVFEYRNDVWVMRRNRG